MSEPTDPNKPVSLDLSGQRVGKYEVKKPIGKGAMGQVYLAWDTVLERDVALKVMAASIADDPELKERFEREARAVAKMTHPNVVMVFDLGSHTDGSPYIAMEFLKGQDLQKAVRKPPPMSSERKVQIIVQVLTGLNHAHQAGIVHRDIKPANIFILDDDAVKIMDFGVARLTTASMTGTGNIVGTADYMSPEQVQGQKVDHRSDLFSVGCLLYELITGRRPFHADNLMAIFYKITHDGANFDLIPKGPENDALLPILKKALARNIEARYQNAYEFAMDLRQWLRAHGTSASTQHVLESLVDLEAPTRMPQPMSDPNIRPLADGTVDLQQPGVPRRPTMGPTQVSGPTVVDAPPRPTRRKVPGPSRSVPPSARRRARPARRRSPLPFAAFGILAVAAVGSGAYYYFNVMQAPPAPPQTQPVAQATPAPAPTVAPTPTPAPVTPAPQPTFAPPEGRAAASVRAANAAFNRGQYGAAIENAQKALREDPDNATAKQILEKAENGQSAVSRIRAGEAALAEGNLDAAEREAQAARDLAPWDSSVADLRRRIENARDQDDHRQERERMARVNELINQGGTLLQEKKYDEAIAAYGEALELDPGNIAAQTGRQGAISAKSVAEAVRPDGGGAAPAAGGHAFVAGQSLAQASHTDSGSTPPGFDSSPEVNAKPGSQGAALLGNLMIEVQPDAPRPGEGYTVSAYLFNRGSQPIELAQLVVTTTINNGRPISGRMDPMATVVAPRQKALIYQRPYQPLDPSTTAWRVEVVAYTSNNDTYSNTLTWK